MTDRESGGEEQQDRGNVADAESAIERLCAEARPLALAIAMRMVPRAYAEDIVQGALMDLARQWRSGPSGFTPPRSLGASVQDAVQKRTVDYLRRRSARDAYHAAFAAEPAPAEPSWMNPQKALEEDELEQAIASGYATLREDKREAHILVREIGMTYGAAGKAMGVDERTARRWVQEVDQRLAEHLKPFWYPGFGPESPGKGKRGPAPKDPRRNVGKEDIQ